MAEKSPGGPIAAARRLRALLPRWQAFLACLVFLGFVTASVLLWLHDRGRLGWTRSRQALTDIEPATGFAYVVNLGPTWGGTGERTDVHVRENGVRLGPDHMPYDVVRSVGRGGHFVRNGKLYFSTSDNGDPRDGRRSYELCWAKLPPTWVRWSVGGGTLAALWATMELLLGPLALRRRSARVVQPLVRALRSHLDPKSRVDWGSFGTSCAVFAVSLVVLGVNYRLHHRDPELANTCFSVVGVPYTDARGWDALGDGIARGLGMDHGYGGFRPGYGLFLACFYIWFGHSYTLALLLNVALGALTTTIVYRIGETLSSRPAGLAAAAIVLLSENMLTQSLLLATEPLGTCLFVLAVHRLLGALRARSAAQFLLAGLLLALSNLARPLTLLGGPLYLLAIPGLVRAAGAPWRHGLSCAGAFAAGLGVPILSWMLRQWWVLGVFAVSPNTADALYAATSPRYQHWSMDIYEELPASAGVKARYDYFNRRARENIKAAPGFYLRNVAGGAFRVTFEQGVVRDLKPPVAWLAALAYAIWLAGRRFRLKWVGPLLAAGVALALFTPYGLPAAWRPWVAVGGLLAVPLLAWRAGGAFVSIGAAAAILGDALFAVGAGRLALLYDWAFALGYCAAVDGAVAALARWASRPRGLLAGEGPAAAAPPGGAEAAGPVWFRRLRLALVLFLLVSLARLAVVNAGRPVEVLLQGPPPPPAEAARIASALARQFPGLLREEDLDPSHYLCSYPTADGCTGDELVFLTGQVDGYGYVLPPATPVAGDPPPRHFAPRDYRRTAFFFATYGSWPRQNGGVPVVFAGELPDSVSNTDCLLVCRVNLDRSQKDQEVLLEGVCLVPCDPVTGEYLCQQAIPAVSGAAAGQDQETSFSTPAGLSGR